MNWLPDEALDRLREAAVEPDFSDTRYRIIHALGRGGMATVYLAKDTELDREVALKVLDLPDASGELATRMLREARIVAHLEHPGIVPIHDAGTLPDGRIFYAMKAVRGDRLDRHPLRTVAEQLQVFVKICEAVAFAHSQSIIHRDLKPANIMIGGFGEVLVMDWGLAKALQEPEPVRNGKAAQTFIETDHGTILGTRDYMAPEQAAGDLGNVNERSDIYALGAILKFLTGGMDKTPRALEKIVSKAMAVAPGNRYALAEELAADVSRYLEGSPVSAYRENVFEAAERWVRKNYFVVILVLAYLIMRVLLILFTGKPRQ